jgi:lysyl-tRNA synthetase class II
MLSLAGVGAEEPARWKVQVDLGDHIFVHGEVITSPCGELSVFATPMLQLQHGGTTARPSVTHTNTLATDLYLCIAPELYLERAVVGGIERVFEINRNFRNEGIASTHSPEFAMLEAYQAYGD